MSRSTLEPRCLPCPSHPGHRLPPLVGPQRTGLEPGGGRVCEWVGCGRPLARPERPPRLRRPHGGARVSLPPAPRPACGCPGTGARQPCRRRSAGQSRPAATLLLLPCSCLTCAPAAHDGRQAPAVPPRCAPTHPPAPAVPTQYPPVRQLLDRMRARIPARELTAGASRRKMFARGDSSYDSQCVVCGGHRQGRGPGGRSDEGANQGGRKRGTSRRARLGKQDGGGLGHMTEGRQRSSEAHPPAVRPPQRSPLCRRHLRRASQSSRATYRATTGLPAGPLQSYHRAAARLGEVLSTSPDPRHKVGVARRVVDLWKVGHVEGGPVPEAQRRGHIGGNHQARDLLRHPQQPGVH